MRDRSPEERIWLQRGIQRSFMVGKTLIQARRKVLLLAFQPRGHRGLFRGVRAVTLLLV